MAAEPRLTSEFWVHAYLARLRLNDIPVFLTAKGDATAGAVIVKLNTLDGQARAFHRSYDMEFNRIWVELIAGADRTVEDELTRQRMSDPDLWIVEVEDRAGRHLLDEEGLA
ncbi:hypothetical protein SAMN06273572_101336 [Monaibacterium marinum]|uniref:GTP-binding protein Era n=1 Tax=Pontivivens marinum TaxID=1690039 RepID=A0A2C9CQ48_9RHOB|nr:DUF1491 family protein [Monaibacterium marinum]SOH92489.1 hypothetical protein SAMN06273572_101336 [Monaibacterium marinum]